MWIRSQNKKILENVDSLAIIEDERKWEIITDSGNVIGRYKTEEKAIEVLDEIHEYKESIETERLYANWTDASYYESHPVYSVYRMPEE